MRNSKKVRAIAFRAINENDLEFLYQVYASTRLEELAHTAWSREQTEEFLRQQFDFQHRDYTKNYTSADFDLILNDNKPVGRLYVDRRDNDIRIIDIALLPDFRRKGIGSKIFKDLIAEADKHQVCLSLHVETNNPILPFYERLNFRNKELRGVYYFMERSPQKA